MIPKIEVKLRFLHLNCWEGDTHDVLLGSRVCIGEWYEEEFQTNMLVPCWEMNFPYQAGFLELLEREGELQTLVRVQS